MKQKIHSQVSDVVSGYILNKPRSFFGIVSPEETVNLVTDPHFKVVHDYDPFNGASFYLQSEKTRRSARCYKVVTNGAGQGICYFVTASSLTPDQPYTFSLDLLGTGSFTMCFTDNVGIIIGASKKIYANGFWQRFSFTEFIRSSDVYGVEINADSATTFYVDGFQIENKDHPTTFCSGAMAKANPNGNQYYAWLGAPNRSMSFRSASAIDGGRVIPLSDLGFDVMSFQQLGFAESTNFFEDYALLSGAMYQGSRSGRRTFTLLGNIQSDNFKSFMQKRFRLGSAATGGNEQVTPLTLLCQLYDEDVPVSEELAIQAIYKSGLEGNIDNLYQEKIAIVFETGDTLLEQTGISAQEFTLTTSLPSATGLLGINADGLVVDTASGCTAYYNHGTTIGPDNNLYMACGMTIMQWNGAAWATVHTDTQNITAIETGPDGRIYFGTINPATAGAAHVKALDLRTGAVDTLGSSAFTSSTFAKINVIRASANGLYIGGHFSTIVNSGGTINTNNFIEYSIQLGLFSALAGGLGNYSSYIVGEQTVHDIITDNQGYVWACGLFANGTADISAGDAVNFAVCNRIGWYPGGYFSLNNPVVNGDLKSSPIYALAYDKQRDIIYAGGHFAHYLSVSNFTSTYMGHVAAFPASVRGTYLLVDQRIPFIYRADNMANGLGYNGIVSTVNTDSVVSGIAVACDGRVAIVGSFDSSKRNIIILSAPGIAFWNGSARQWLTSPLQVTPQDNGGTLFYQSTAVVYGGKCGKQAAASSDYTVGQNLFSIDLPASFVAPGLSDSFFFDIGDAVGVTAVAVNEIDNQCAIAARPSIEIHGPCTLEHIINLTTGKSIYLDGKVVYDGETVVIDTDMQGYGLFSNTQGDQTSLISTASAFPDFPLKRGINKLIVKLSGIGDNTAAYIFWKKRYASIDALAGDCTL